MSGVVQTDREEALRAGGPAAIAQLFGRVPALALLVEGRGPLTRFGGFGWPYGPPRPLRSHAELARRLAVPGVIEVCEAHATRTEAQLLALAVWEGGTLASPQAACGLAPGASPEQLERAACGLDELLLVDRSRHWLQLRPGVALHASLPGVPAEAMLAHASKEQLGLRLQRLGMPVPAKHGARLAALVTALRDRSIVSDLVATLDDESRATFEMLVEHGDASFDALPGSEHTSPWSRVRTPLERVVQAGLGGLDQDTRVAFVWLEVLVAVRGCLFREWQEPAPQVVPAPSAGAPVSVPIAAVRFDRVVDQIAVTTPAVLKSGGFGSQAVRALAKATDRPPGEVALWCALAIELGLVGRAVVDRKGRGRNQVFTEQWRVDGEALAAWRARGRHPNAGPGSCSNGSTRRASRSRRPWPRATTLAVTSRAARSPAMR